MGEGRRRAGAGEALLRQAQAMHEAGRLAEAKELYRQAIGTAPSDARAWVGLGTLARQVGVGEAAVQAFGRAAELAPRDAGIRAQYAHALQDQGSVEQATAQFREACRLRPEDALAWESLGIAEQTLGEIDAAAQSYRRASRLDPRCGARLKLATLVSPIMGTCASVRAGRERVEAELDALLADATVRVDDPMQAALWSNFYLAFHGENDRDLQAKYAALYRRACPSLEHVAPHCAPGRSATGRIRVGLLSKFFFNHSIGRTSRGLFPHLSREEFEVTAIFVAPTVEDDYSRFIRAHAEHVLVVPQDLARARSLVGALELDVLFYQDIGMEPFTYFLAFSRLAPVQCVSFGHPDTTGIPAMDYFVSNDLYETPEAAEHYSERLFLLHDLPTLACYDRPVLPQPAKRRAAFGLAEGDHLYLCPQNLFKFHPDMDDLIAAILRRDPLGKLVVIEGRVGRWTALMRERWAAAMPDVAHRIVFLPRQNSQDYLNLIAIADVMLDTVHFNGMNTSLEALSVGTPVVTLPGRFQRGRHTQAMYRKMGFTDCIASDAAHYVELSLRLATDEAYRIAIRQEIASRSGVLFGDTRVVREFERFFRETAGQGRLRKS